jgi:hypothetical protein
VTTKPESRGAVTLMSTHRSCQRALPALGRSAPLSAGTALPQRLAQQPAELLVMGDQQQIPGDLIGCEPLPFKMEDHSGRTGIRG